MTRRRFAIHLDEKPAAADVARVVRGLRAFNERQTGRPLGLSKFALYVKDGDGAIVGGIVCFTYWDWMYVDYLWLDDGLRRRGFGRRLLDRAERIALGRGCRAAWLDTFSFQAPGFYRRMGYTEFGVLDDHPSGARRHYFAKRLVAPQRRTPARRR